MYIQCRRYPKVLKVYAKVLCYSNTSKSSVHQLKHTDFNRTLQTFEVHAEDLRCDLHKMQPGCLLFVLFHCKIEQNVAECFSISPSSHHHVTLASLPVFSCLCPFPLGSHPPVLSCCRKCLQFTEVPILWHTV